MIILPKVYEADGVDHIRLHVKAATSLGCRLNEFYTRKFSTPEFAEFDHLLGYSLFLRTGCIQSKFRHLPPLECLELYKKTTAVWNPTYKTQYNAGLLASLHTDPELTRMLLSSTLPLVVYKKTPNELDENQYIPNYYMTLRETLKNL